MTALSSVYAANAPIASTVAALGITPKPAAGGTPVGSTNARTATAFDPNPAAVTGGGPTSAGQVQAIATNAVNAANQRITALGATPAATPPAAADVARNAAATTTGTFGAQLSSDLSTAAGGGAISDALQNGVAKIAAFAQNGIKSIEQAIQGDMNANNGQVDPAKMQQYTMQMSTFEMIMQMAAKIQEKQENATQIWLR